jgi:hypothetical protein
MFHYHKQQGGNNKKDLLGLGWASLWGTCFL